MSTASLDPTATLATGVAPSVVTIIATVTVTAAPAPELYLNSFWGCLATVDMLLFFAGIWTALIVGFNVLSFLTILIPAAAAVGNGLLEWQIMANWPWRPGVFSWMQIAWAIEHFGACFYTYFILKRLLSYTKRLWIIFSIGFWLLALGYLTISIIDGVVGGLDQKSGGKASAQIKKIENDSRAPSFMLFACLELWAAAFLLVTLYEGRRTAKRVSGAIHPMRIGLLRQLAQSSEVRLATIAAVGIIRTCSGWTGLGVSSAPSQTNKKNVIQQIDNFAVILENMYPVLLIIDLLAARMVGSSPLRGSGTQTAHGTELDQLSSSEKDSGVMGEGDSGRKRGGAKVAVRTMDSIRRDFGKYLGRRGNSKGENNLESTPRHSSATPITIDENAPDLESTSTNDASHKRTSSGPNVGRPIIKSEEA